MEQMIQQEKQIDLVGAGKFGLLFVAYLAMFILFYALGVYSFDVFQSVGRAIAEWPLPSLLRSMIILSWEVVPIMMILVLVNLKYLKLAWKKFLICTISFIVISVLFIEIFFWAISFS